MTKPMHMALPVPPIGHAIGCEGDAYIASLLIELTVDGERMEPIDGATFEAMMTAARLRHLCFHPRTRAFIPNEMKAPILARLFERHWSSIDSLSSDLECIVACTDRTIERAKGGTLISWRQIN